MAEFNEEQENFYNSLISQDIDAQTANDLTTGKLSADDYKASLEKNKTNTQEEMFEAEGYDVKLMTETKAKIAKKTKQANEGAAADDFSQESIYLADYKPSKKDIVKSYGINADIDNELPKGIRLALGLGIANEDLAVIDAKKLYKKYLIEDKEYDKDLVESLDEKLQFKYQELPDPSGKGKTRIFTYRVPEELGGTNKWTVTNSPTILPTAGDLAAIAGDAGVVAAAIGGGMAGSTVAPILGTMAGSATATGLAELTKLYTGRLKYDLASGLNDDQFFNMAIKQAALTAGIDLVATPAFLLVGQSLKKAVITAAKDKISVASIDNLIKSGAKLDEGVLKNLDEARNILKDNGIDEKLADDYLVANIEKVFPESGISVKLDPSEIATTEVKKSLAEKTIKANDVENKLIKLTSGLDDVNMTAGQKDDVINRIAAEVESIRANDIKVSKELVEEAEGKVIKLRPVNTDPTINEIDNMGITFNDINIKLKPALSKLEKETTDLANKSNVKFNLDLKDTRKILNQTIERFDVPLYKKMKTPTKTSSKEYIKAYKENQSVLKLAQKFSGDINQAEIVNTMKLLKNGLRNIDDMTYQEAMSWKSIIMAASENESLPAAIRNPLRKVKGDFDTAIRDGLPKDPALLAKHTEFDNLLSNYRSTFIANLADSFGYGTSKKVTREVGLTGVGKNTFKEFTDGSNSSLVQAEKLSNLLNTTGVFNTAQKNKINNALYDNYFNEVVKGEKKNYLKNHNEFIKKYGKNYELILGKKEYAKFASSQANALKVMDDAVQKQIEVSNAVSTSLPGMNVAVIDKGNSSAIVKQILSKFKSNNVDALVKNLNKTIEGRSVLNDVRKVMVYDFLDKTKVNGLHNGKALDNFLNEHGNALEKLFNKEFVQTYRSVAKALTTLQDDTFLGVGAGRKTLTEVANQAGLFIDIFAGPLNHKRLIVNRLSRIFDMFNLGGDNLNLLLDYKLFIEAAKKDAFGGNYNVMLDVLGSSNKPIHQGLMKRLLNAIGIGRKDLNYKGLTKKTLLAKEYVKDKTYGDENNLDEPDTFEAVDKVLERLGKGVKQDVLKRTKMGINLFIKGLKAGYKNITATDLDEKEFNEKLKK